MQKIVNCKANKVYCEVQPLLDRGWKVIFMVAENVASSDSSQPGTWGARGHSVTAGDIVFVLEREDEKK